jgi:hypothetical protein
MDTPGFPNELVLANWQRQGGAAATARPTTISDALQALRRGYDAVDFSVFDAAAPADAAALETARQRADTEAERKLKPLLTLARACESAADKWSAAAGKDPKTPRPAVTAAAAIGRAVPAFVTQIERFIIAARQAFAARAKELGAAQQKEPPPPPKESPERARLRSRLIDRFRVVKLRPDQKVVFLLCIGHTSAIAYLGDRVSDSLRPQLMRALAGDTGFKFYKGEVKWEESSYTFIGPRLSTTIARRIERGVRELTGSYYRIRGRE